MRLVSDVNKINRGITDPFEFMGVPLVFTNGTNEYSIIAHEHTLLQDPSIQSMVSNGLVPSFRDIYRWNSKLLKQLSYAITLFYQLLLSLTSGSFFFTSDF